MLLYGCGTWTEIPKKTMKDLNNLSLKHLRVTLGIGKQGFPIPCLYLEWGILTMENRKLLQKLSFVWHLANLSEDSLAHELYQIQLKDQLPGVAIFCQKILEEWGVGEPKNYTKQQWRKMIKAKIEQKNKEEFIGIMKEKKFKKVKAEEYEDKEFKMSDYFKTLNVSDSKMRLRAKLSMVQTVRNNFHNNKKFKAEKFQCPNCLSIGIAEQMDSQSHLLTSSCEANSDLREGRDFSRDQDICDFFRELVNRRMEKYGT